VPDVFRTCLQQVFGPYLREGDTLILDLRSTLYQFSEHKGLCVTLSRRKSTDLFRITPASGSL
jgi:hypothetical protein